MSATEVISATHRHEPCIQVDALCRMEVFPRTAGSGCAMAVS